ncbi:MULTISPECIES: DUF2569 domain-containing protein [Paenibacillus]|uniref:DUF2569 domain-containing protein n=1 Tax=Paenibacillus TaxID=44249 RepID=UPI0014775A0B|nr:DUF2569 domain-containing protein [Paenibacillus anaericanus]
MKIDKTETWVRESLPDPLGVSGLGGWLVLIQIGLYITIIRLVVVFFQFILPMFSSGAWEVLTSQNSMAYHALWGPIIIFETVYNIIFLFFAVYILIQLYQKKSIFPRLMIIFYIASLLAVTIDIILMYQIPLAQQNSDVSSFNELFRSIFTCAIWIPYFIKSTRVKNTFTK